MSFYNDHFRMMAYLYRRQRHRIHMMQYMMQSQQKRKHRFWIREIIRKRDESGSYRQLVQELQLDCAKHHQYFRMSAEKLEFVLSFVGPVIQKQRRARDPLEAKQRLAICIRFLATGESYTSLATQYRVGLTTVSRLVPEVCEAIWETMRGTFLKMPQTPDEWKVIALDFEEKWNFPHCVGALDGKHVVIKAPMNSGSLFYNYKSSFSVVLMALTDAYNRFLCVDIGAYGRQSDAGVFSNSAMGHAFVNHNTLNLPNAEPIHGAEYLGPMPYVAVGDEAFPLQHHIMRPYPGRHSSLDEDAYNYRHSRARRIVECSFGILATRWRVFYTRLSIQPGNVVKVVQGAIVLHNMLQTDSTPAVSTYELLSDFRVEDVQGFEDLAHLGTRGSADAVNVRNRFKRLFAENPLPWQNAHIQRGLH